MSSQSAIRFLTCVTRRSSTQCSLGTWFYFRDPDDHVTCMNKFNCLAHWAVWYCGRGYNLDSPLSRQGTIRPLILTWRRDVTQMTIRQSMLHSTHGSCSHFQLWEVSHSCFSASYHSIFQPCDNRSNLSIKGGVSWIGGSASTLCNPCIRSRPLGWSTMFRCLMLLAQWTLCLCKSDMRQLSAILLVLYRKRRLGTQVRRQSHWNNRHT